MPNAIHVHGLGKRYRLGACHATSIREMLARMARCWRRKRAEPEFCVDERVNHGIEVDDEGRFWALQDVSFALEQGEVLGIVGRNGSGKSTLLKILSQITAPTVGWAELEGRVASLLEVGTGFHQELSGRENVFLNGAILGMHPAEIRRKFDAIVAFAEVEKFIDTPVKRYSSGMYVRLAFAVAAHLEPEILLVDEVLAVGDGAFQQKCLGKMSEVASSGRTVLFVSHNNLAVRGLCTKVLWLNKGQVQAFGDTEPVLDQYVASSFREAIAGRMREWASPLDAPGNDAIRLARVAVCRGDSGTDGLLTVNDAIGIEVEYWNLRPGARIVLNSEIFTSEGVAVFESFTNAQHEWHGRPSPRGRFRYSLRIPAHLLNEGSYRVRLIFLDDMARTIYDHPSATYFTVHDDEQRPIPFYGKWQGVVRPRIAWQWNLVCDDVGGDESPRGDHHPCHRVL